MSTSSLVTRVVGSTQRADSRLNGFGSVDRRRHRRVSHVINLKTLGCFVLGMSTHGGVLFGPRRDVSFGNGANPFVRCACTHVHDVVHGTTTRNVRVPTRLNTSTPVGRGRVSLVRGVGSFTTTMTSTNGGCGPNNVTGCYCRLAGRFGRFCRSCDVLGTRDRTRGVAHLILTTGITGVLGGNVTLLNVRIPREVWGFEWLRIVEDVTLLGGFSECGWPAVWGVGVSC